MAPRWPGRLVVTCALAFGALTAGGCNGAEITGDKVTGGGGKAGPNAEAERLYVKGMKALATGDYLEAMQTFRAVLKQPTYLTVTALARLRLADCMFHQDKFEEAIDLYLSFLREHEGDPNAPYAEFMIGRTYFERIPGDMWILPPSHEKDQSMIEETIRQLRNFMVHFPRSRFVPDAQRLIDTCESRLRAHDAYVVDFYADRKLWRGVASRLEKMLVRHPIAAHTPGNYRLLGSAYEQLGWIRRADDVWAAYVRRFPTDPRRAEAEAAHKRLGERINALRASGSDPDAPPPDAPKPLRPSPERAADEALDET